MSKRGPRPTPRAPAPSAPPAAACPSSGTQASPSELETVLDAIEYGVLLMDRELNVRRTNRAYRRIWDLPSDLPIDGVLNLRELYQHTRDRYAVPDAQWEAFIDARLDRLHLGASGPRVSELRNGKTLQRQVYELPDGGRMITYFDITELKQGERELALANQELSRARDALRLSEDRYALAIKGSNDGVWDWSRDDDTFFASPRFREIAGVSGAASILSSADWTARIHGQDLPGFRDTLRQHLRGESELFVAEYRTLGDDGAYRWVQSRGIGLRGGDGRVYRMAGSLTDITTRKEAEIALREGKDQAEKATRVKSQFLANMSHELRTPLNAIIGITEMLQEDAPERDPAWSEPLTRIESAGRHLLRLINDILDLSKIEAGRLELRVESFEASKLIREVVTTASPLAARNHNELHLYADTRLGQMRSDPTRVRQIVLNLLGNACKFTTHGEIALRVRRRERAGDQWLELVVSDNGIGMSEEQLAHLFEEFTQGDPSTTRRFGGTGLGLTICRRLCHLLGGDIVIRSTPGEGTQATVSLPLQLS